MDYNKYLDIPSAKIPDEIASKLFTAGNITKTKFEDKNIILSDNKLYNECGYTYIEENGSGYYLVSMYTPMPKVAKEMVEWWFWWHPQHSKRYQSWYPKEHIGISYAKKNKGYFNQKNVPPFESNTQYPIERVGKLIAPLSIEFVSPESFGFSKKTIEDNSIETIVCGHVGAFYGLIPNTEMAHIFVRNESGLLLVSRFWLGKNVKNKFLKNIFVTQQQAKGMAEHCCIEYRNFAEKIPLMYKEWDKIRVL